MDSNDLFRKWDDLEADGYHGGRFRIFPDSALDFFIGYSRSGEREFTLESGEFDLQEIDLPIFEHIILVRESRDGVSSLSLKLNDGSLTELFTIICNDLAGASSAAKTVQGSIKLFEARLGRWSRLLKRRAISGLTLSEQLGLLGELTVLVWLIEEVGVTPEKCVLGWRGADGDDTDIGINGVTVEVKAQLATQVPMLKISSLDQLAEGSAPLFIVHCQFSAAEDGISLAGLVDRVSSLLDGKSGAYSEFKRKLFLLSYEHAAAYATNQYSIVSRQPYRIGQGFPRLTRQSVPLGISNAKYEISCAAVAEHGCQLEDLAEAINGRS